eukprot:XP_001692889.1 predicted protein [Chlamydomonas reinhardtii]
MAADPGVSGGEAAAYHLFLTRIPPRVPKEEVEAALSKELASRGVMAQAVSVVPQSAWKTKGYGFITLSGKPSIEEVQRVAEKLDNELRVGGKAINVRVCEPSSTGAPQPVQPTEPPVLHCYFARRSHQPEFKAEKLLALLSMTVAPSRGQEPKPLALWAKEVFGSMEQMLLAIGDAHFGASTWSLTGAVAERSAKLAVGKARNMQGWDPLRDPLPIATLLRLAACRQRLDESHTPQSQRSGFSTPTCCTAQDSCRRSSDCGSLSAVHSSEQPSCSQSEASWSLRSGCNGAQTGSAVCSPPLDAMTSSGSEEQPLSTASPASVASYDSLRANSGSGSLVGATSSSLNPHVSTPSALPAMPAVPPSARDLLHRCATHLQLLFQWHPAQLSFAVPYLAEYLSAAPDVVAWGSGSPYFSLQGYAAAVYGSFEGLLLEVSRVFFGGCWRLEGGQAPGEPRVLCVPRCAHNVMLRSHGSHGHAHHGHQLPSHGSGSGAGSSHYGSRRPSTANSCASSVSGGQHGHYHSHHQHRHYQHNHGKAHGHGHLGLHSSLTSYSSAKQLSRMSGGPSAAGSGGSTGDGSAPQPVCAVPASAQRTLTSSRSAINLR